MRLDDFMLNYSLPMLPDFSQRFISFGSFGLDKHLKTPRSHTHYHAEQTGRRHPEALLTAGATTMCRYGVERWESKRSGTA